MEIAVGARGEHVNRLVRPHRQRLAERILSALRPRRENGDLGVARLLGDPQRLFDSVLVEFRQQGAGRVPGHGQVIGEVPISSGVGHVLHTDDDSQIHVGSPP